MSNKLITLLILALVVWAGYRVVKHVNEVKAGRAAEEEARNVTPEKLPGVPSNLEGSLQVAQREGAAALRRWLDQYGSQIQDPRKAWIELDYCTLVARSNPREAKAVFAGVKARTRASSPVFARMKELERTLD